MCIDTPHKSLEHQLSCLKKGMQSSSKKKEAEEEDSGEDRTVSRLKWLLSRHKYKDCLELL